MKTTDLISFRSLNCGPARNCRKQAVSLLKSFDQSPLGRWRPEDGDRSRDIVRDIQGKGKHVFVCSAGGSAAPTKILKSFFSIKGDFPFLLNEVTESRIDFLKSLDRDVLRQSHWLFISKSGQTASALFYIQTLRSLALRKKIPLKDRITCLTARPSSPLVQLLRVNERRVFQLNTSSPGRFSFFTLGGLVQGGLLGLDPLELGQGLKQSRDFHSLSTKILSCILLQFQRGDGICFFSRSHSRFRELSLWWEDCWSESLFKHSGDFPVHPLRACSLSEMGHTYLEELFCPARPGWVWNLNSAPLRADMKNWGLAERRAMEALMAKERRPFLSLSLERVHPLSAGLLMTLLFQVLYGLGLWLKADFYKQPFVDKYKKRLWKCYRGKNDRKA